MKLEIELSDDDIQSAIKGTVLNAINLLVDQRTVEMFIQKRLDTVWKETLNRTIDHEIESSQGLISQVIKKKVADALERQIMKQVKAALNKTVE